MVRSHNMYTQMNLLNLLFHGMLGGTTFIKHIAWKSFVLQCISLYTCYCADSCKISTHLRQPSRKKALYEALMKRIDADNFLLLWQLLQPTRVGEQSYSNHFFTERYFRFLLNGHTDARIAVRATSDNWRVTIPRLTAVTTNAKIPSIVQILTFHGLRNFSKKGFLRMNSP